LNPRDFLTPRARGNAIFTDHALRTILQEFATPIVKAKKKSGKAEQAFFTLQEYENWREENEDTLGSWQIKYYKGLGTSSSAGDVLALETRR
jgi:DNA gyrase/topoisomerase IV subunit B